MTDAQLKQKLQIKLYLAPHRNIRDLRKFLPQIPWADVYIPEAVGWKRLGQRLIDLHGPVTQELVDSYSAAIPSDKHQREELQAAVDARVAVTIIDLPEGHPLIAAMEQLQADRLTLGSRCEQGSFEQALRLVADHWRADAKLIRSRERYMLEQLPVRLAALLERNRELAGRSPLKVLIALGALHTSFGKDLAEAGYHLEVVSVPVERTYNQLVLEEFLLGREPDQLLLARSLIALLHPSAFNPPRGRSYASEQKRLLATAPLSELKETFEKYRDKYK
jgi:hypothetical protein